MERLNWQSACESVLHAKESSIVNKVYLPCAQKGPETHQSPSQAGRLIVLGILSILSVPFLALNFKSSISRFQPWKGRELSHRQSVSRMWNL